MRRKTSILTSLTLAAMIAAIPSAVHADTTVVGLRTEFDRLSADRVATVTLKAKSPSGITNIAADVSSVTSPGTWTPFAELHFERLDGTDNDGTWRAEFRTDIEGHPGTNRIAIQIRSADGATLTRNTGLTNCYATSIVDLQSSPSVIDIDDSELTARGRVVRQKQYDAPLEPMSGITVTGAGGFQTQTGTDGSFALTSSGHTSAQVFVSGQGTLCGTGVGAPAPTVTKKPTTATARLVTPQPVPPGTLVRVQGQARRQGSTGLVPAVDVPFHIVGNRGSAAEKRVAYGQTTADGTIDIEFLADASGPLTVVLPDTEWLTGTTAPAGALDVRRTARIAGFDAGPEPLPYGGPIDTRGTLTDATGAAISSVPVVLEYSADGKTGWRTMYTATTSNFGEFYMSPHRITRDGYWRVRFAGDAAYAPAVSWVDHVDVKYRTYLYSFNASPEPVKKGRTITVKGELHRFMDNVVPGPGATIYIYFKANGTTTWKQMAVTKTDKDGWFKKTFTASKDGTWMATYKGGAAYIKSNAPTDHVDVR